MLVCLPRLNPLFNKDVNVRVHLHDPCKSLQLISIKIPVFPVLDSCNDIYSNSLKPKVEHVVTDISCYPGKIIDVHDAGARTIVSGLLKAAFVANNVLVSCPKEWTPSL